MKHAKNTEQTQRDVYIAQVLPRCVSGKMKCKQIWAVDGILADYPGVWDKSGIS